MQGLRTLGIVELFYSVLEKPFTLPSPVPRSPPARKLQEAEKVRWAGSSNQHAADQNAVIRYRPYRKHNELFEGFSETLHFLSSGIPEELKLPGDRPTPSKL